MTEFDPLKRFASRTVEAAIPFGVTQRYEETTGGTRLDWLSESDGFGGFLGELAESVVVGLYARDLRSNLEALKQLIESQTA